MGRNGNPYFHFQHFSIWQDRCAMKVGVDGILLGAWARVNPADRILDVGTGTGLLALMMAQRAPNAQITAIEIDPEACLQAQENVMRSPWAQRIHVKQRSFQEHLTTQSYDLVIANPPFFNGNQATGARAIARETLHLSPLEIIQSIRPHLTSHGRLALIVPFAQVSDLLTQAIASELHLNRRTNVRPTKAAAYKRSLLELSLSKTEIPPSTLTIEQARHCYSSEYKQLTASFLLKNKSK